MPSVVKKDLRNAVLKIKDGGSEETTVIIGSGNISFTVNTPMEYELDRGNLATGSVRKADEQPVEVSVTCRWIDIYSDPGFTPAEAITPYEALKRTGAAAAWETTGADNCEPYAVELELTTTPVCLGGTAKPPEVIVFSEFRADTCNFDLSAGTLAFSGMSKEVMPAFNATTTRPTS